MFLAVNRPGPSRSGVKVHNVVFSSWDVDDCGSGDADVGRLCLLVSLFLCRWVRSGLWGLGCDGGVLLVVVVDLAWRSVGCSVAFFGWVFRFGMSSRSFATEWTGTFITVPSCTPQDEKVLPMDDIQLFRKIMRHYFLLTNPSTGGKIQFILYWNWMVTVFSLHISTTLHLTIFGIWGNNIQSVQNMICVMIVRGLWYIGLAIRYTIMLRIYVHHGAPFCVLTVKRHCLPFGGAPAVNHKATAIWLALRILAGNEHCNVCDGNMVSEYIFNFFMATYEWMHPKYVCRICNYLFCIHAKFYKHISPSYYSRDPL